MPTFQVTNATELQSALGRAVGGDTILLAAGDYGSLNLNNKKFTAPVTVKALSATGQVHFDGITVSNSSYLTFKGLDLGRGLSVAEPEYTKLNTVQNSANIRFVDVSIHGSLDNDPTNDGIGFYVTDSKNVYVHNAKFTELFRGALFQRVDGVGLYNSSFEGIRSDGANFAGNDHVVIRGNTFTDFNRYGTDHADAIQFWNTGQTKGQSDITISDNVFIQTVAGKGAQGIFMSDNETYKFRDVTIENNLMFSNDDYHGISVNNAENLRIANNTITSASGDDKLFWILAESSTNVTVVNNVTDRLILNSNLTNLVSQGNITLESGAYRNLLPNLVNPHTPVDLIAPGVGYQAPTQGPLSSAASSFLSGMLGGNASQSHASTLIPNALDDLADTGGRYAQQLSVAPLPEPIYDVYQPAPNWAGLTDHWIAHP
ncbi:hypothetical protein HJG53_03385 [Sphingomonas sp. ID1715]|uniref:right-handed parallel beta-helix repeat-containing protein n=1 Tax=Sphingomonas sp. ID1715 TaxID=1656898 RepID=UPI001488552A|nr:right-handed parallel beta-helix repeat-containing protein [Sphingomonas sp. ID1715]NNM75951.1 hypothetical protein [Sphingomonas sp. ID1715]